MLRIYFPKRDPPPPMNIARFKDKSFHLERIPLSIFTVIKRSGQKWIDKIYIMLSTKLSKKEISK